MWQGAVTEERMQDRSCRCCSREPSRESVCFSGGSMIQVVQSFLISPGKNRPKKPPVRGTDIPMEGKLFGLLSQTFDKAEQECVISIRFPPDSDGSQSNPFRSLLVSFLGDPTIKNGRAIAGRLRDVTTETPGLGLLFLIAGKNGEGKTKVLVSRFPAEQGILAETSGRTLSVKLLEKVFMKSHYKYKAAVFIDSSLTKGFWTGAVVDKQRLDSHDAAAEYWVESFLAAEQRTTSAGGTRRLAVAMKKALASVESPDAKERIVASAVLSRSMAGKITSVEGFIKQFGLEGEPSAAILEHVPPGDSASDPSEFDLAMFESVVPLLSIELDNGGMLTAPAEKFQECFQRETVNTTEKRVRFTTTGKIVDQRLRGRPT